MTEDNKKTCKSCKQLKLRLYIGTFDGKNKKYIDESERLWNGRKCPDCHNSTAKKGMRTLRFKTKFMTEEPKE